MQNRALVKDYIQRAAKRLLAVELLFREKSWADVVRESQEVVELSLKALLRSFAIEVPRIHDVSGVLDAERAGFPAALQSSLDFLISASKTLRRDRELSFYGAEDLTPSEFYAESDARAAMELAQKVHRIAAGGCAAE